MYKVCHGEHKAPSTVDPALPPVLDLILNKALAKDPAQRYQKAGEMAADLAACRAQLARPPDGSADPYAKTLPLVVDLALAATVPQAKTVAPEKRSSLRRRWLLRSQQLPTDSHP